MARVVGRSRPQQEGNTGLKFTEIIVFTLILVVVGAGVRYYYQYRKGPVYALKAYFDAIKAGNEERQYALIDDEDKKLMPTKHEYAQHCKFAQGYTERVADVVTETPVESKNPSELTIKATVAIRDSGEGKELYQGGGSHSFTDTYFLRKSADGDWKIVLSKSGKNTAADCCDNLEVEKAKPSPPGMF